MRFDVAMKNLLDDLDGLLLKELCVSVTKWINVELPLVMNQRIDLLGLADDESLIQIEIQSDNDNHMAIRMFKYYAQIYLRYEKFPHQIMLYIGQDPLRVPAELNTESMTFRYRAVDIRDLDGERLAASAKINDNILAILARLRNREETVRSIKKKIDALEPSDRDEAFTRLLIVSGLRGMEEFVKREVGGNMVDMTAIIMNNKVLGPEFKKTHREGREEGLQEGGANVVRRLIEARFGDLPGWVSEKLSTLSEEEFVEVGLRVLSASDLDEVLRSGPAVQD